MKGSILYFCALAIFASVVPAAAQVVDLAGPWIIDFPQGRGMAILKKSGGSPPTYSGKVTIPYPKYSKGMTFDVKLGSHPSYLIPGNNITFYPHGAPMVGFFMMNVSSGSSGIAWIIPSAGADKDIRKFNNVKAPAHR